MLRSSEQWALKRYLTMNALEAIGKPNPQHSSIDLKTHSNADSSVSSPMTLCRNATYSVILRREEYDFRLRFIKVSILKPRWCIIGVKSAELFLGSFFTSRFTCKRKQF